MEGSVKERLKHFLSENKIKGSDFCAKIGVSSGFISGMRESIQPDKLKSIAIHYPLLDIGWLMTGMGQMQKNAYPEPEAIHTLAEEELPYHPRKSRGCIPLVDDIKATCGIPDGFSVAIKKDDCTPIVIPGLTGEFAIRAKGRSMINRKNPEKSINENNIIVCNRWNSRSHIRWGEVYALATNDGVVVKQLMPSEQEGYVRCVSFNEYEGYKAYDLPVLEISDWAIVVGVVNISLFT